MRSSLGIALASLCGSLVTASPAVAEPLVGPTAGNADLLIAEGARFYNEKAFEQARDRFLKATRAAPSNLQTYLSLARAYFALKDLERSCTVYRVYVKSALESPDRQKAQGELDLCERQLAASGAVSQFAQNNVSLKASFFDALDKGILIGAASAGELLTSIVGVGYAAPDLGDMAAKLARAAELSAEATYKAALAHQRTTAVELRKAAGLYLLALDCGAAPLAQAAHAAFLEGLALMAESKPHQAELAFEEAVKKEPADAEARFYRGLAKYQAGDKAGALKALEADLPSDPRTGVLRVAVAMDGPPEAAAGALEKFLFARRYQNVP